MLEVVDYLLADVVVIGGGVAGCRAALEAVDHAASVILVDQDTIGAGPSPIEREPVFAACAPSASGSDSWQHHFRDTLEHGEHLGQGPLALLLAREALRNAWDLERYGFVWKRGPERRFELLSMDGHTFPRGLRPEQGATQALEEILAAQVREQIGLRVLENLTITTLLQQAGEIVGAVGLYPDSGQLLVLTSSGVIVATGGMSGLYDFGTRRGSGVTIAYRPGAEIIAPEMQAVSVAGAGDAACYSLGGLRIDDCCRTTVRGLYAAGEAAGGVHGARLLTGNKLTEAAVFGARAGRCAALDRRPIPRIKEEGVKTEIIRLQRFASRMARGKQGGTSPRKFGRQLNRMMQKGAGAWRTASALEAAARWLEVQSQGWLDEIEAPGPEVSGAQLREVLEVDALLELAQVVVKAAMMREESRGAHQRKDFPETDPAWAANITVRKNGSEPIFTRLPAESGSSSLEGAGMRAIAR